MWIDEVTNVHQAPILLVCDESGALYSIIHVKKYQVMKRREIPIPEGRKIKFFHKSIDTLENYIVVVYEYLQKETDTMDLVCLFSDDCNVLHSFIPFFDGVQGLTRLFSGGYAMISGMNYIKFFE